ncbi:MAG: hypothetical protein R2715_20870 [Ilumatobacteraceae bacterium]
MSRIVARRSGPLSGTVVVPGAKNSVLKLMAATILADGTHRLTNVPGIADVGIMCDLLGAIGVRCGGDCTVDGELELTNTGDITPVAPYELVERIRASINVLGPLLGRFGTARISLPGGDDFGSRPIDMHIKDPRPWAPSSRCITATWTLGPRSCAAPTSPCRSRASAPRRTS